jgi:hypothetical protein
MASQSRIITKGATSQSVNIIAYTTATGARATITSASAGLALWYRRQGAAKVAISASDLSTLADAFSAGGLLVIADGDHRLDVADAAFATGVNQVEIGGSATGITIESVCVQLTSVDLQDATRGGMTALPNANAAASGGLMINGANTGAVSFSSTVTMTGALVLTGGVTWSIDSLNIDKHFKSLLAVTAGKVTVTDNGDGTSTYVFKQQDGATTELSVTTNNSTSARTATATPA